MRRPGTVVLVLAAMLLVVPPAAATTTTVPISGTGQVTGQLDAGREWTAGAIHHVRGRVLTTVQFTDDGQVGLGRTTVSFALDTTSFEGRVWGTGTVDYGGGGYDSTFQGSIHPDPTAPGGVVGEFTIVGHGWGDLEGTQLRATGTEFILIGMQTFEGVTFVPGDR